MVIILRYFSEFGKPVLQKTICGGIYARAYCIFTACTIYVVVKKVHVRYLISWWVSCYSLALLWSAPLCLEMRNGFADFDEIWHRGSSNAIENIVYPDPCVAQQRTNKTPRAFTKDVEFLANVNSRSRSLYMSSSVRLYVCLSVCRLYVVCNVRAPYLGDWNFRQCFYAIGYLATYWHPGKILRRSSQGNPSFGVVKRKSGSRI